jgi:hypothetical protein
MPVLSAKLYDVRYSRDRDGYRTYKTKYLVHTTQGTGPNEIADFVGLPALGSMYDDTMGGVGTGTGRADDWCFCHPDWTIEPHQGKQGEVPEWWSVEIPFSNKPLKRCQDLEIDNPIDELSEITVSFGKKTIEAERDKDDDPIVSSSHEKLTGAAVEFDKGTISVKIKANFPTIDLGLIAECMNRVNAEPMWGLPTRCVKLSGASAERKLYGCCSFYYTITYDLDVDNETFDRNVLDEGTKVLNGHWATKADAQRLLGTGTTIQTDQAWVLDRINGHEPDPNNPQHFIRYKDRNQENARVILNGNGTPANTTAITGTAYGTGTGTGGREVYYHRVQYYKETNLLLLGIPSDLNFSGPGTGTGS